MKQTPSHPTGAQGAPGVPVRRRHRGVLVRFLLAAPLFLAILFHPRDGGGDGDGGEDPRLLLQSAAEKARVGSHAQAAELCRRAIKSSSEPLFEARARFLLGWLEFQQKRYEQARSHFREVAGAHPLLSYHALYYGGRCFLAEGDAERAQVLFDKLLELSAPGDLEARTQMELLRHHRRRGEAEAAAVRLKAVESLSWRDPSWARELDYTRGWVRLQQGAMAEARSRLHALWRDHPESFWAGQAENLLLSRSADLLLPGEESLFTDGDRVQRINKLIEKNRHSQALDELAPVLSRAEAGSPPRRVSGLYKIRGEAQMGKREFKSAIASFRKAQGLLEQEDVELTYLIGRCHQRSGAHQEAIAIYRGIFGDHSQSRFATRALFYTARLMKLNNDFEGAEATYRRLAGDYPGSTLRPESLFQIAWINYLKGDLARARMYITRVPHKSGDREFNARTLYWKSVILSRQGESAAAAKAEDSILRNYWDTNYAFYLVVLNGRRWPYQESRLEPPRQTETAPLEFNIARELLALGINDDAQGQLTALDHKSKFPEWVAWAIADLHLGLGDYFESQRIARRKLGHRLKAPPPAGREAWSLAYPQAYQDLVMEHCVARRGLDPHLVWSLMRAESTYRPRITSWAGAIGLMQVMPATGRQIASELGDKGYQKEWLFEPERNIVYGCYYLKKRLDQFNPGTPGVEGWLSAVVRAAAAYNAGAGRVQRWAERADQMSLTIPAFIEEIPIVETRNYVKRILGFYLVYHHTYPREQTTPAPE